MSARDRLAFDRSMRQYDDDGRLRIARTNIAKACVSPYKGDEIPNFAELGLDPNKIYYLLRDPEELKKSAETFNLLPVLDRHIFTDVDQPNQENVVGSLGSETEFDGEYLTNSMVISTSPAIAAVESRQQSQISPGYRYDADMTPGTFNGEHYDGVMRNIRGNHIALVEVGRQGPDVIVADSDPFVKPQRGNTMSKRTKPPVARSRVSLALAAGLAGVLAPRVQIAADASLGAVGLHVADIQGIKDLNQRKAVIVNRLTRAYKGKLAADASMEDVAEFIDAFCEDPEMPALDEEDEEELSMDSPRDKIAEILKGQIPDEMLAEILELLGGAEDEGEPGEPEKPEGGAEKPTGKPAKNEGAMDTAKVIAAAVAAATKGLNAAHEAREMVKPLVGAVIGMDSADAIYKFALEKRGVDVAGIHPSAFKHLVKLEVEKVSAPAPRTTIATDSATIRHQADTRKALNLDRIRSL